MYKIIAILLSLAGCSTGVPPKEVKIVVDPVVEQPKEQPITHINKSLFPEQKWADHVWLLVADMPKASDEKSFCPKGLTRQNWVHLFASMAKHESNFKPALTYKENFKNSRGEYVISTGLFQVSYESSRGYGFQGITTEQLKDPYNNINVAVRIMKTLVARHGVVSSYNGGWKGGSAYWSVLRSGKAQATLKPLCE